MTTFYIYTGGSRVVSTPRPFPVKVVLLPDFLPTVHPSFPKIREFSSLRFEEHVVMFEESDTPISVFNKYTSNNLNYYLKKLICDPYYRAFPILNNPMGGIQMFGQSSTRSSPEIEPFISAI